MIKDEHSPGRKRVLSEISINTVHNKDSELMKPPTTKRMNLKESVYSSNRIRPSNIPVATPTRESKSKILDISTCMGIKQKLKQAYGNSTNIEFVPPVSNQVIPAPDLHSVETQVKTLSQKIDDLKEEIHAITREQHKVHSRIADINNRSLSQNRVLEREIEKSAKDRNHMEQMLQLQIQNLGLKLDDDYNELKFNLQSEIEQAKQYQNEDIIEEIKELNIKLGNLRSNLEQLKDSNQKKVNEESMHLKQDLEKYVSKQAIEIDKLSEEFDKEDKELQHINEQYAELQTKASDASKANDELQSSIKEIEHKMAHFPAVKSALLKSLTALDERLAKTKKQNKSWEQKVLAAEKYYTTIKTKQDKYDLQRRILENSIMNYEGKTRIYIRPTYPDPNIKELDTNITINNRHFSFNKVFKHDASDQYVTDEFSCFVQNSVSGPNASIVFVGRRSEQLLSLSIINSYQSLLKKCDALSSYKVNFNFKCLEIEDNSKTVDLLDSSYQVSLDLFDGDLDQIPSQQMIIDSVDEFTKIVHQINESTKQACLYIIKIQARNATSTINSNLMFLDLTSQNIDSQISSISSPTTSSHLSKVLKYTFQNKCLLIGNINNDVESMNLLECLEQAPPTSSTSKI